MRMAIIKKIIHHICICTN